MWYDHQLLQLCESLKQHGRISQFRPGARIGRGFADVGYEEFVLLPNGKSMSLFAGTQADFLDEHRGFFFEIPTIDDLLIDLAKHGLEIISVTFADQRTWHVKAGAKGITTHSGASRDLHEAFARCVFSVFESQTKLQKSHVSAA